MVLPLPRSLWSCALLGAALLLPIPSALSANPRSECETIVKNLGYPVDDYAFKEAGIFSSEQHIFGSLSCFVDSEGKFDSLYRGDTPVAEDGYYGLEALAARDAAIAEADAAERTAKAKRDAAISNARAAYDADWNNISNYLASKLEDIRNSSKPPEYVETGKTNITSPPEDEANVPKDQNDGVPSSNSTENGNSENSVAIDEITVPSQAAREMWVTSERLDIRSCPNTKCGRTGWLLSGNRVEILEETNGWGRISEPLIALCEDGITFQIDDGNNRCDAENGIVDDMITKWVEMAHLTSSKPAPVADPADCSSGFLSGSDNYAKYSKVFCEVSRKLIEDGECTEKELKESGGWWASTTRPQGTFFTYCGGMSLSDKIYLDVSTGETSR